MSESTDECSVFDGYGWLALFSMSNQGRKIFRFSIFAFGDIMRAFQTAGSCDVNAVFVAGIRTWKNSASTPVVYNWASILPEYQKKQSAFHPYYRFP